MGVASLRRLPKPVTLSARYAPNWRRKLVLPTSTQVYAGLHDSNAALLAARGFAEIADHEATVLSTGTWFVAMRSPKKDFDLASLPEARDCLVNVDAYGRRFRRPASWAVAKSKR